MYVWTRMMDRLCTNERMEPLFFSRVSFFFSGLSRARCAFFFFVCPSSVCDGCLPCEGEWWSGTHQYTLGWPALLLFVFGGVFFLLPFVFGVFDKTERDVSGWVGGLVGGFSESFERAIYHVYTFANVKLRTFRVVCGLSSLLLYPRTTHHSLLFHDASSGGRGGREGGRRV